MASMIRRPAVAGRFYPQDRDELRAQVRSFFPEGKQAQRAVGCIVPHAGYMYSGHVAGAVYAGLDLPSRCILLCPNHTGFGHPLAIMSEGAWETPLGLSADRFPAGGRFERKFPTSCRATRRHIGPNMPPKCNYRFCRSEDLTALLYPSLWVRAVMKSSKLWGMRSLKWCKRWRAWLLLIASSDMNHYENDAITRQKDYKAIERILVMDARGLYDVVMNENISMCGFGPTVAMLTAARRLGAARPELVKYATSGDISGDRERVVGYAGIVVR